LKWSFFAALFLSLTSCGGGGNSAAGAGVPPCNAWIILFGNADLRLDCPAAAPLPLFKKWGDETKPPPPLPPR